MQLSRRHLLLSMLAAAIARRSAAGEPPITPPSPAAASGTRYARFANLGGSGRPERPVQIEPAPGLRLVAYMPQAAREARVVLFSHGELSAPEVYGRLLAHWASHGFAVLAPVHDDSVFADGLLKARRQDPRTGASWDLDALVGDPRAWRERADACRAALDALPILERTWGVRLLADRAVVAGHSFGAYTAQLLLGVRALVGSGEILEEADPRFHAAMLLSPQGRGTMGLVDGSWDGASRPMLVATGKGDGGQDPAVKAEPFALSPAGNKHLAWFARISPTLYSGQQVRPGTAEQLAFQDLLAVTTAFLAAYANRDADALADLAGGYYERMSGRRLAMRRR